MNLETLLTHGLGFVSAFTPKVGAFLFLICFFGEAFVITIPLLLETTWLAVGYQATHGVLPLRDVVLLMLSAQLGRQAGALLLYALSRGGTPVFTRFIARRIPRVPSENPMPGRWLSKLDAISPFGVALGRILWLRVPITLWLGARRKLKALVLGIAISSTIYECIYIGLGAVVGRTAKPQSGYMLLYFMGGLAVTYGLSFGIRYLFRRIKTRLASRRLARQQKKEPEGG